jgi:hypothetical protein
VEHSLFSFLLRQQQMANPVMISMIDGGSVGPGFSVTVPSFVEEILLDQSRKINPKKNIFDL